MPIRNAKLREQYRETKHGCELAPLVGCCNGHGRGMQIHHILQGPNRHDIWPNFLLICDESHRWVHAQPIDGRIACWLVKLRSGEFDAAAIREAWGQCPIGWIERKASECRYPRWVSELLSVFS